MVVKCLKAASIRTKKKRSPITSGRNLPLSISINPLDLYASPETSCIGNEAGEGIRILEREFDPKKKLVNRRSRTSPRY